MPPADELRLGVDVGGTNTDAVVVDRTGALVAKVKVPTTPELERGIEHAIARILDDEAVDRDRVSRAMLGTTQATNAVLTRTGLRRVAVMRIGGPLTGALPPLVTWPAGLRRAVEALSTTVAGGCEFDGQRLAPLDEVAVRAFAASIGRRAQAVAITAVFPSVDPTDELRAAEIVRDEIGGVPISMSHEIGSMGLMERENATVLNAALSGVAGDVVHSFVSTLDRHGLEAETYFTQNDGTLMALEHAIRFPCLTVGSGPANSMRGSAHISGLTDAIVADIGGTTTDVGLLVNGFPWESTLPNAVGDVDTNFRLPDIVTVPIGGGCVVRRKTDRWTVDVRSLGHALVQEALCFGGFTPTLTDAAVAAGRARIGDRPVPAEWAARLSSALAYSDRLLADAIERVRLGPDDLPLVIVGGGSIIAPATFPGIRRVVRPPHAEVANAIGAAIAPVGGQAERICANRPDRRADAVADISSEAIHRAIHAGADPALVRVVEVDEVPLTYLLDPAVRIKVRAVGPLAGFTRTGASRHERKQPPGTGPGPLPHTEAGVRPKEATR